jgi:hypothetical protein
MVRIPSRTSFSPSNPAVHHRKSGEELVRALPLYDLEVTGDGEVVEESRHDVAEAHVPKAVLGGYRRLNLRGVSGMATVWSAERAKGKARVYTVSVIFSEVSTCFASFKEDGSLVSAPPSPAWR